MNTVFRVCGKGIDSSGDAEGDNMRKPVAIYQHGLLDCCASIICSEKKSLGLKLVDEGYDLWINNSRGNRYSRDH
jgi:hypothetical protein